MKLTFIRADHEVTGSCTLLEIGGHYGLIDCGMEQGRDLFENIAIPVPAAQIEFVLVTHAHMDHTGHLPLLYKQGFRGTVYATEATCDLCGIMLRDAAHIQMSEAEWKVNSIENLSSIALDINQLLFGLPGVAMIILGNIMPKLRMNSIAGLRTVWSMKNETTWKKSQRFGGISFIVGGVIIIIVCFLTKGFSCFWWTMGIVAILLIIDTYYTYTLSKKY